MKKYDLSKIMKRAWEYVKKFKMTISSGLKRAWMEAKNGLKGSPKQIAWANDIRNRAIDVLKLNIARELKGYHPKIPFIVDIPTQYCILIADWSGDFCRTLAWSIFDDSETSED